jgi:hypothetical protein
VGPTLKEKFLASAGIRTPDHPARIPALYYWVIPAQENWTVANFPQHVALRGNFLYYTFKQNSTTMTSITCLQFLWSMDQHITTVYPSHHHYTLSKMNPILIITPYNLNIRSSIILPPTRRSPFGFPITILRAFLDVRGNGSKVPRHMIQVKGERQNPASLPSGNEAAMSTGEDEERVREQIWKQWRRDNCVPHRDATPNVQPENSHFTDWAIPSIYVT